MKNEKLSKAMLGNKNAKKKGYTLQTSYGILDNLSDKHPDSVKTRVINSVKDNAAVIGGTATGALMGAALYTLGRRVNKNIIEKGVKLFGHEFKGPANFVKSQSTIMGITHGTGEARQGYKDGGKAYAAYKGLKGAAAGSTAGMLSGMLQVGLAKAHPAVAATVGAAIGGGAGYFLTKEISASNREKTREQVNRKRVKRVKFNEE
jgi:hypothetical protein